MPLDQMHSANPPSHPDLLAWLARDTVDHGYDLRRLIRGLVLSRAYAHDSHWEGQDTPRPALFAVAAIRPLTPLQLAASLRLATTDPATLGGEIQREALEKRIAALEEGARSLASELSSSGVDSQIGVAEALFFSNGKRVFHELLSDGEGRLVTRLKQTATLDEKIELAVGNVLSRPPDDEDRRIHTEFLAARTDRPDDACRQLVWALVTCAEFRFNH
jgi:hypothetical protein